MSAAEAALGACVLLLALGGGGEIYARSRIRGRLEKASTELLGSPTSVTIGRRSVFLQAAARRASRVGIDTDDRSAGPEGITLHGYASGVTQVSGGVHLESLRATVTVPLARIRQAIAQSQARSDGNLFEVRSVSLMPRREAVSLTVALPVAFGFGIDVRLAIRVDLEDGRLQFHAIDLSMPLNPMPLAPVPIPVAWAIDSWVGQLRPKVVPPALDALTIAWLRWDRESVTGTVIARDAVVPLPSGAGTRAT